MTDSPLNPEPEEVPDRNVLPTAEEARESMQDMLVGPEDVKVHVPGLSQRALEDANTVNIGFDTLQSAINHHKAHDLSSATGCRNATRKLTHPGTKKVTTVRAMVPYVICLMVQKSAMSNPDPYLVVMYAPNGARDAVVAACKAAELWRYHEKYCNNIPHDAPWPEVDDGAICEVIDDEDFTRLLLDVTAESRAHLSHTEGQEHDPWCFMTSSLDVIKGVLARTLREGSSVPYLGPQQVRPTVGDHRAVRDLDKGANQDNL